MSILRVVWAGAAALEVGLALRAVGPSGLPVLLTVAAALAATVATAVSGLVEDGRRWSRTVYAAAWAFPACVVLLGLPIRVGPWIGVVALGMAASCPPVLARARREWRRRRPVRAGHRVRRLSGTELEDRWRRTQELLPTTGAAARLSLVCERAVLLEEIERRDPTRFAARLERAGWPAPGATAAD